MSNFNFKAGDKVYYPRKSNKILTTENNVYTRSSLLVGTEAGTNTFTTNGKQFSDDSNPSVFPATQEWYEKLVQIYPDLEPPEKHKEAREIILAMLNNGWSCVPCRTPNMADDFVYMDLITQFVMYDNFPFKGNQDWKYARPFDPKSGKYIVDYVDGKVVLED